MKARKKIMYTIAGLTALGLIIHLTRRHNNHKRLSDIADEGYETAHDVLYPNKSNRGKLHYGPVLPAVDTVSSEMN